MRPAIGVVVFVSAALASLGFANPSDTGVPMPDGVAPPTAVTAKLEPALAAKLAAKPAANPAATPSTSTAPLANEAHRGIDSQPLKPQQPGSVPSEAASSAPANVAPAATPPVLIISRVGDPASAALPSTVAAATLALAATDAAAPKSTDDVSATTQTRAKRNVPRTTGAATPQTAAAKATAKPAFAKSKNPVGQTKPAIARPKRTAEAVQRRNR